LLDTLVVSEWVRPWPDPGVAAWLAEVDEDRVYLSVLTLAELRQAVERMPRGSRRQRLDAWSTDELPLRFEGRVLPVDTQVAEAWGRIVAARAAMGKPIGTMDAFIAATAMAYDLALVTCNAARFEMSVETIVNPWHQG
jgi:hypothetical protein